MRIFTLILIFTNMAFGKEKPILSAAYKTYVSEGITFHVFTLKNTTNEGILVSHLASTQFSWQTILEKNTKPWIYQHKLQNIKPRGYAFIYNKDLVFSLRSDRHRIYGTKGMSSEPYILIEACKISSFQKEGINALKSVRIPLIKGNQKRVRE